MSIKVQNSTDQVIPLVIPSAKGGEEVRIAPRQTVILAINEPTAQINFLVSKGILKIRK